MMFLSGISLGLLEFCDPNFIIKFKYIFKWYIL